MRAVGLNPDVHPDVALDIQLLQQVMINTLPPHMLNPNPTFEFSNLNPQPSTLNQAESST